MNSRRKAAILLVFAAFAPLALLDHYDAARHLLSIKEFDGAISKRGGVSCAPRAEGQPIAIVNVEQAIAAAKAGWLSVHSKASWHSVYSPESIAGGEPYGGTLKDGVWSVSSSQPDSPAKKSPRATVCQSDGAVVVSD